MVKIRIRRLAFYDRCSSCQTRQVSSAVRVMSPGLANQELLLQNEYVIVENRSIRAHLLACNGGRLAVAELCQNSILLVHLELLFERKQLPQVVDIRHFRME